MQKPDAQRWIVRSDAVAAAQAANRPVVALESTIIAHGMPYPDNVRTAREVEAVIRDAGAEPATIAVIGGKIRIGLGDDDLELLGRSGRARKVSRRDLPAVLADGSMGATTVAATMICARLAGIEVFVTGGIGGVHRGAAESFDISADLQELAKTSVAVVCAGAKSVLDIGLTLEYLETHGVPVIACGQYEFAAFYTRGSGFAADLRIDDPQAQARFIRAKWDLGLEGGVVVSVPVPQHAELPAGEIEAWTAQALAEAAAQGVTGKAVTPFLLSRIAQQSGGRSLAANIALVKNNAAAGARLALALHNRGMDKLPTFESFRNDALSRGFDEVLERVWKPGTVLETHTHPFAADAIVVQGEMWLEVAGDRRRLLPGDTFQLDREVPHSESYGPEGATYWVARKN